MGMMQEFLSNADGQHFSASIVPVRKTFHIPGPKGMRFLNVDFDSLIEIAVYRKKDSPIGFLRMLFPPDYLVEINDYFHPLVADDGPLFCQDILRAENILYTDKTSDELKALQEKWEVIRFIDRKNFIPFFKKVPIVFYMRQRKE